MTKSSRKKPKLLQPKTVKKRFNALWIKHQEDKHILDIQYKHDLAELRDRCPHHWGLDILGDGGGDYCVLCQESHSTEVLSYDG